MNSGNSFFFFLFISLWRHTWKVHLKRTDGRMDGEISIFSNSIICLMVYLQCSTNSRFMGFTILFIWMHFNAIVNISIIESFSDCIITLFYIVITIFFNTSLDYHHATDDRFFCCCYCFLVSVTIYEVNGINRSVSVLMWNMKPYLPNKKNHIFIRSAFSSLDAAQ